MSRDETPDAGVTHNVACHLGALLARRGMTLVELAERTGVTVANLSVLKNGRARAIRFSTLTALCRALDCQPGELLEVAAVRGDDAAQPVEALPEPRPGPLAIH